MKEEHPIAAQDEGLRSDPTGYPEPFASVSAETLYHRLAGYGFVRRYAEGKIVANIGREGLGYGSHLLSGVAERVVGLTDAAEVADLASHLHPAPNVEYRRADLPALPYPEDHFDVVVALEASEDPGWFEGLVDETARVLGRGGVLIASTLDRRALLETGPEGDGRRRGMYVPEFRELLGRRFGSVRLFRHGAAAGGFVFPEAGETADASVESAPASALAPSVGPEAQAARSVLAVCSLSETPGNENPGEVPYILLDRDRRVFDEREDLAEDVELLREEIGRMQETEVQAFQDSYKLLYSEIAFLRARIRILEAERKLAGRQNRSGIGQSTKGLEQVQALQTRIREMENSTTWRLFEPYRRLRAKVDAAVKRNLGRTSKSDGS